MSRYNQRIQQYNNGQLSYNDFVNSNFVDYMSTAFATTVSISSAGKVTGWATNAGFSKLWANVAGGAVAGATFDTILQLGLQQISDMTNGRSGKDFSVSEVLTSTAFGGALGGLATMFFHGIGELIGIGGESSQAKLGSDDPVGSGDDTVNLTLPAPSDGTVTVVDTGLPAAEDGAQVSVAGKLAFQPPPPANSMTISAASS